MTVDAPELADSDLLARAAANPLHLDQQLCFALYASASLIVRLYRPHLDPLGLTYPQYLVMLVLWERAPFTVGEIGQKLELDSATLTPLLKRLERRGYLTRTRDPADERRVLVAPTEAGTALREAALGVPEAVACQIPLPLADLLALREELTALRRVLPTGAD